MVGDVEINEIEVLIPFNHEKDPMIHYYEYKALTDVLVSVDEFFEYKKYWNEMISNMSLLSELGVLDSLINCDFPHISDKSHSWVLRDNHNELSTALLIPGVNKNDKGILIISSYIFVHTKVVFVKITKPLSFSPLELKNCLEISKKCSFDFLMLNR